MADMDLNGENLNRPKFQRPIGTVGMYVDVVDVIPADPTKHGSQVLFMHHVLDQLYDELRKVAFDIIKGAFEQRGILDGVIIETISPGVIYTMGFDHADAVESLWKAHQSDQLQSIVEAVLNTGDLLQAIEARTLTLRCRLWEDEIVACRKEITTNQVPNFTVTDKENDVQMLQKVKENQKIFAERLISLRDKFNKYDQELGNFVVCLKQNIFYNSQSISTRREFVSHLEKLRDSKNRKGSIKSMDLYLQLLDTVSEILRDTETGIFHPLSQVHTACETEKQRELKRDMKKMSIDMQKKLTPTYNFTKLKHTGFQRMISLTDQRLMCGLISLPPFAVQVVVDIDEMVDEYISGFKI